MTAPAVIGAIAPSPLLVGPFRWLDVDSKRAREIALALDLSGVPGSSIQSELVRDADVDLLRGAWPSLMLAWRFCHAARMLNRWDDLRVIAFARQLGGMIASAAAPGWTVLDVVFAEFGSSASYIGRCPDAAILEQNGILKKWMMVDAGHVHELNGRAVE